MTVVTPTTTAAPAGWYRDPLGIPQLRWWNGIAWTNHIQDNSPELPSWTSEFTTMSRPSVA